MVLGKMVCVQCSSVDQACPTLCDPMDRSTPGLPVHHPLPELGQTPVHQFSDALQPSHPLASPSTPAFNFSHQVLFQWVSSFLMSWIFASGGQSIGASTSAWILNILATWCEELTHWKRWWWERLKAGEEGDDSTWDGWMASPTQWTWVWVNFVSC